MMPNYQRTRIACYLGYITQAIVNNLAPLLFIIFQEQFGVSYEQIGRLILINFGTQILADLFAMRYADRIGYRRITLMAHIFCVLGLVGLGVFPQILSAPYVGLMISVVIYALGGGLIEVVISPIIEALPGEQKAASMSFLHSFYCWGQMLVVLMSTLFLWGVGRAYWFILPACWALVPLLNCLLFAKAPLVPLVQDGQTQMPLRKMLGKRAFLLAMALMIASGASELTMSQWSSLFAERGLGVSKVLGDLLGPCLFALLMGSGRLFYGLFGSKLPLRPTLLASGLLCVGCYLVAALVGHLIVSLLACALCGLSVAQMWPGTISLSAAAFPLGGTAMFGALAVCGDIGAALGPWLAGLVSDGVQRSASAAQMALTRGISLDQLGLKSGLLLGVIFPVLFVVAALLFQTHRKGGKTTLSHPGDQRITEES